MKKLKLSLASTREVLTRDQMRQVKGGEMYCWMYSNTSNGPEYSQLYCPFDSHDACTAWINVGCEYIGQTQPGGLGCEVGWCGT